MLASTPRRHSVWNWCRIRCSTQRNTTHTSVTDANSCHTKSDSRYYRRTGGFFAQSWPIGSIQVFRQYRKDALLLIVLTYNVGHNRLLGYAMANARRVTLSRKSSPATGIFTKSISRTVATQASQSPVSNAVEKESFNYCIYRSRYLKILPLSNWEGSNCII